MELNENKLANRYAASLVDIAAEKKELPTYVRELGAVCDIFDRNKELYRFAENPLIVFSEKQKVFKDILKPLKPSVEIMRFINLLAENSRVSLLPKIKFFFEQMAETILKESTAIVYSTTELDKQTRDQLKKQLEKQFNVAIDIKVEIKPEIIAGLVIHVRNQVIDCSIKGELERIRQALKQEG